MELTTETTTYTVTVAVHLIPNGLRPTRTYWAHPVYQIEEEDSWLGFAQASVKAYAEAEQQYGKRMADTSYVMEVSPVPV